MFNIHLSLPRDPSHTIMHTLKHDEIISVSTENTPQIPVNYIKQVKLLSHYSNSVLAF